MIVNIILQFIASFFGTIAFSIMFCVPRQYYPCCGLIGGLGWITCWSIMNILGMSNFTGTFVAAAVVVLLSRICGVGLKCPATLFMLSGLFPLVPGVGIYWTVYSLITGDLAETSRYGRQTFGTAIAIVLGICFVFEIPQKMITRVARIFAKREGGGDL